MAVLAGWTSTGISREEADTGLSFSLSTANPVSVPFSVSVSVPIQCELSVMVYDVTGRETAGVVSGAFGPGEYSFTVNGLNEGVYFIGVNDGHSFTSHRTVVVN